MTADLPPAIALVLDEFRGKTLDLAKVRTKMNDEGFLRDFSDQCLEGIRSFPYADRLEPRLDKFDLYAGGGLNPCRHTERVGLRPVGLRTCTTLRARRAFTLTGW